MQSWNDLTCYFSIVILFIPWLALAYIYEYIKIRLRSNRFQCRFSALYRQLSERKRHGPKPAKLYRTGWLYPELSYSTQFVDLPLDICAKRIVTRQLNIRDVVFQLFSRLTENFGMFSCFSPKIPEFVDQNSDERVERSFPRLTTSFDSSTDFFRS